MVIVAGLAVVAVAVGVLLTRGWSTASARLDAPPSSTSQPSDGTTAPTAEPSPPASTTPARPAASTTEVPPEADVATDERVAITGEAVAVTLTDWGWSAAESSLRAAGFVEGVVQAHGTCTLTATRGGVTVTAQQPALPDASTTSCGELRIPGDELTGGIWRVVLSYESPSSAGASAPVDVEVAR